MYYKCLGFMGYPNYHVGKDGSVWFKRMMYNRKKILVAEAWYRKKPTDDGYRMLVNLSNEDGSKTHSVHRLILLAFVGPCPEEMEACHWDGNHRNNRLRNLRWDTHIENELDKERHGTRKKGDQVHCAKLTPDEVRLIRRLYSERRYSMSQLAVKFGITLGTVHPLIHRRTWKEI